MSWSISVKTVGNTSSSSSSTSTSSPNSNNNLNSNSKGDFTIQVEPNEVISSLHRKIEEVTGLKSSQQRLIYRGRLISSGCPTTNTNITTSSPSSSSSNVIGGNNTTVSSNENTGGNHLNHQYDNLEQTAAVSINDNNNNSSGTEETTTSAVSGSVNHSQEEQDRNGNESSHDHPNENHSFSNHNNAQSSSSSSSSSAAASASTATKMETMHESRICDVVGLSDGQTIHLVPRINNQESSNNTSSNSNTNSVNNNSNESSDGNHDGGNGSSGGFSNGPSGAGLLAALLGLGSSNNNDSNNNNNNNSNIRNNNNDDNDNTLEGLEAALSAPPRLRSSYNNNSSISGSSSSRRRPHSYRRNINDPLYPEPCPLEPIRQGLMTLHTMIGEETMSNNESNPGNNNMHENSHGGGANSDNMHKENENRTERDNTKPTTSKKSKSSSSPSPLNFNRKWYIGQWLDCRDTVNQWLEATVIDIAYPQELINSVPTKKQATIIDGQLSNNVHDKDDDFTNNSNSNTYNNNSRHITQPYIDPAIGANDLEGRTKLLLEPAEDEYDDTLSTFNNNDESLIGFQERKHNTNIQLLKIHYNGWPHRWDEWIRSDSERIRPFRTRSRHVPSVNYYNPSPQSVYRDSPATFITSDKDEVDRIDVLPEIYKAINVVQSIFEDATPGIPSHRRVMNKNRYDGLDDDDDDGLSHHTVVPLTKEEQDELTNAMKNLQPEKVEKVMDIINNDNGVGIGKSIDVADIVVEELEDDVQHKLFCYLLHSGTGRRTKISSSTMNANIEIDDDDDTMLPWQEKKSNCDELSDDDQCHVLKTKLKKLNKQKLEALAPLFDRLGRVLIDFAPHVASIAESMPDEIPERESDLQQENCHDVLETLVESNESSSSSSEQEATTTSSFTNAFMPLRPSWSLGRDTTNDSTTPLLSSTDGNGTNESTSNDEDGNNNQVDPDYIDFVNGFINPASRGEVPRRTVRRSNSDSFGSSLLSAFLASTAGSGNNDDNDDGPRVLRLGGNTNGGGNGNNGIDIHIHAIVTGPNGGGITGTAGLDGLVGLMPPPTATRTTSSVVNNNSNTDTAATRSAPNLDDDDEELGLFSDLYAENGQNENRTASNINIPYDAEVEIEDEADDVPPLQSDEEIRRTRSNNSIEPTDGTNHQENRRPSSSSSTSSTPSRRSQMFTRILRRALSRRNNSSNN